MRLVLISAVLLVCGFSQIIVQADCPDPGWQGGFGAPGVTSGGPGPAQVNALQVWDPDGAGGPLAPVLVVGGAFDRVGGAPNVYNITVWDGQSFRNTLSGPNLGLNGQVLCIRADNNNSLYVGGTFTSTQTGAPNTLPRIARWNPGAPGSWQSLAGDGLSGQVNALFIEPSGALMVGGLFANFASGGTANRLARWGGAEWSTVDWEFDGSTGAPYNVRTIFDWSDSEYRTYVGLETPACGGDLDACVSIRAPAAPAPPAPFPGTGPITGRVNAALQTPDGRVWAGGSFTQVRDYIGLPPVPETRSALGVAHHDLTVGWTQAGAGLNGEVLAMVADGNTVYAGGQFTQSGSTAVNHVARWDGAAWQPLGGGVDGDVLALAIYNGQLYAGGSLFTAEGKLVHRIARWDGTSWRALGNGSYPVPPGNPAINCIARFEDQIVAGGPFTSIGGDTRNRVARFTGSRWEQIGQGLPDAPEGLFELDGDLYALGVVDSTLPQNRSYTVQRFDAGGALWTSLGGFDNGFGEATIWNGQLVVAGAFTASGTTPLARIAIRDGNGVWQPMGAGFNHFVTALIVFNGDLIAGGFFTFSGSTPVARVARWDGTAWQPMGTGLSGSGTHAEVLYIHNGELYAGGNIDGYLRRWTGSIWEQVGNPAAFGGCFGGVNALSTYYGDLIVGGGFSCGSVGILRWDGAAYGPMAAGVAGVPNVANLVAIYGDLWMNGVFTSAGEFPSSGIALWRDASPWILVEPAEVIANPGDDVTLSAYVHTDSFLPITLQWFRDDQEIDGATSATLTLSNVQASDAGEFRCAMDTFCGLAPVTVQSNIVTLTVAGVPAASMTGAALRWEVKAVRNDLWVQQHGAPVEVDKQDLERGTYQHPELYGQPPELGMNYRAEHERPSPAAPLEATPR